MQLFTRTKSARHYYPSANRMPRIKRWLQEQALASIPIWRGVLILLALVHLGVVAVYPGGKNAVTGAAAPPLFSYLTPADVGDASGFYKPFARDHFFFYRIFPATGEPVEGSFPDLSVTPRLRYERWAFFAHHAVQGQNEFQGKFLEYLTDRLSSPPLRLELFSARWHVPSSPGFRLPQGAVPSVWREVHKLGEFDGLRQEWAPVAQAKGKK